MAQTGYTPIILFHSTTASNVPTTSNLAVGELGLNNTDGKLYYNTGSAIAVLAGAGGAGIAGGSNTQVQYNSSGSLAGSANMTFDGSTLTTLNSAYTGTLTGGTGIVNLGSGQFYKDASGNVGIGTSSPSAKLDVLGTINAKSATVATIQLYSTNAADQQNTIGSYYNSGAGFSQLNHSASFYTWGISGSERMRIDSSGNVGIGTSSPTAYGGFTTLAINNSTGGLLDFYSGGSAAGQIFSSSTEMRFTKSGASYMSFYTNSAERMRIDSSGGVCIGTTSSSASASLTTFSVSTVASWFQTTNSATSGVVCMYSAIPTTAFNANCAHFAGQTSGINTWYLYGNGATSYVSDQNLKKNIVTTRDGYLDDVAKLRVVKYQWKANSDDSQVELGLIAQEVAEVFPTLVKDSISVKEGDPTNKVILGSVLQPILIKCVQELYQQLQELKVEVDAQALEIATLKAK